AASMTASTAAAVGNTAMVIGVGLDVASVGTGIVGEVLGGKTGDLLGKVSLGLGLAGGVAGGFGGGMRIGAMTRAAKVKASTVWPEAEPVKYYDRPYLQRGVKRWSPVKKRRPDLEGGQSGRAELAPVYKRIRKIQRDQASDVSRNARVLKQRIELNEMLGAGTKQFWDLETKHVQTEFKYVEEDLSMNTSTCLHLYPCDGKATDHLAASLPPLPEPVPSSRGSGTPASGIQATSPHSVMQNQGGMPHQQQPDDPSWETTLL
nr:hypothetical protein [Tanacetum cinerariifolium]